jgi:DNA helicase II / ATP-dependent DNA helicase PcrA
MSGPDLNEQQQKAVDHISGPLLMAAGAGSGKTKALTSRLKALVGRGIPPHEIVAITFTNKAAREMRERVFGKENADQKWRPNFPVYGEPFIGTFHSFGAKIMKNEAASFGRTRDFTIYDDDDSSGLIKRILKEMELPKDVWRLPVIEARISNTKSELRDASTLLDSPDSRDQVFAAIFDRYERALKQNNAFDFDDLIEKPVRLFAQQPEVLKKYQTFFTHILVDEYQDINTCQYQLVRMLSAGHSNLSVVGDDFQSIYAFRGADYRNFLNFTKDWPGATIIKLEQNYRSTGNIINAANAVIKNNTAQTPKKLWTENPDGAPVSIIAAQDSDTEAGWLAGEVWDIRRKDPAASAAVLYRTNAQSRAIEQALISANLPYKIYGGLKFYDRKEVKDVLAAVRIAYNPVDSMSAERLQASLGKRVGAPVIAAMQAAAHQEQPIAALIDSFMRQARYKDLLEDKFNNAQERLENIAELIRFASEFPTVGEFLERAALLQGADEPSQERGRQNPVNLMTIHIAKGLEFDYVFVIGVNEGVLPHERSMDKLENIEEERRLMYVAMTRARTKLYILFHSFASRFVYEIPRDLCEFKSCDGIISELPDEDEMWLER